MGKRSTGKFERVAKDFYRTPYEAVVPLLPHIQNIKYFIEPCAGDGILIEHLKPLDCVYALDIDPPNKLTISTKDALTLQPYHISAFGNNKKPTHFITNPPWSREILHPLIEHLSWLLPTWLLFDADWAYTKQSIPYMKCCRKIVAVGRVRWFPATKMTGKDNAAWYLFDKKYAGVTGFYGR
jgi:hypothetical protein